MNLADAKKLKPGDRVSFGDAQHTRRCSRFDEGVVVFVTGRGGVKLRPIGRTVERWVPYHHLVRKLVP